jgi:hypothetical protein
MYLCWQRFTHIRAPLKKFTVLATTSSSIGWWLRFLRGSVGFLKHSRDVAYLPRQFHHQLTIHNDPVTLADAFAINIYITHKTVLLVYMAIRAPMEHLRNAFSSHSFHINDNTNIAFPPTPVIKFSCSSNQVNGASNRFNNGNVGDAVSTCTTDWSKYYVSTYQTSNIR